MEIDEATLKRLVEAIVNVRTEEIGCDSCFEEMDCFAEMTLEGKNAAELMPLVENHLALCRPCREEFEALLDALQAIDE